MNWFARKSDRLWRVPNDLAFDAALVAVFWHMALAQYFRIPEDAAEWAVLGLSVWLVYLGDRWLDVRGRDPDNLPTQRHSFIAKHHRGLFFLWVCVLILSFVLAEKGLSLSQFLAGLVLLSVCIGYTLGVQKRVARRVTKELQIGLIYAAGVGIFFVGTSLEGAQIAILLGALILFAIACWLNCSLIASWEVEADRALGRSSLARALGTRVKYLRGLALALGVSGLAFGRHCAPVLMLGVYGLSLFLLDWLGWPGDPEDRRCVADGWLAILGAAAIFLA